MKKIIILFLSLISLWSIYSYGWDYDNIDCVDRKGEIVADIWAEKLYICLDDNTAIMIEDCEAQGMYAVNGMCQADPPTGTPLPPDGNTNGVKCRCKGGDCYAGNTISFRVYCGRGNCRLNDGLCY